ncbi:MAG: MFS transporter [Gammaproteobacteria bacterium]|nr:MFS transporter [Gammaproteobacteria bacterium]
MRQVEVQREDYPAPWYAWLTVAILFVAYIFSFIDRMILSLLVEPMKRDLSLTDTQFSLLQGFAFAILYTFAGLPMGRLIDRTSRVRVIALGVAFWSLMTTVCGMVSSYWQLFLARVGVGVGEATLSPAAYSIFADSFRPQRLGLALGVYNVGAAVGGGLAMIIGGYVVQAVAAMDDVVLPIVGQIHAWQMTFLVIGPPGIVVALLVAWLREPPRHGRVRTADSKGLVSIPLNEVIEFVKRHRKSLAYHHLGVAVSHMAAFGAISWTPVLLVRVHQWPAESIGMGMGLALIIGGVLGFIGGGWLGDVLARRRATVGRLQVGLIVALLALPATVVYSLQPNPYVTVVLLGVIYMCAAGNLPSSIAALNELAPNQMRAQLSALFLFVINLIGLGLGATLVALCSDYVFTGDTGIRYSLAVTTPVGYLLSAVFFRRAFAHFERSMAERRAAP